MTLVRWLNRSSRAAAVVLFGLVAGLLPAAEADRTPPLPPMPPPARSPVAWFRQLLSATPEDLAASLQGRSESQRRWIEAKLDEYRSLPAGERELRLGATELHWYLRPLLSASATNRPALLERVPEEFRAVIDQRLKNWDALPAATRDDLLRYESAAAWVLRSSPASRGNDDPIPAEASTTRRLEVERRLGEWQALPESRRRQLCDLFQHFFELSPRQKERTLNTFTDAERHEIESTLREFERLRPEERLLCLRSFQRLAQLTPRERAGFLTTAERWRELSPADRQTWRLLVRRLPPMPPGLLTPPQPPSPAGMTRPNTPLPPLPGFATNR